MENRYCSCKLTRVRSRGNVFSQLHKAGFVDHDIFGMCLARGSSSNGTFTLGGLDPRLCELTTANVCAAG